jgi:hypothetical protein
VVAFSELASLRLFNEKAVKLLNTRFVKCLEETGQLSVSISANKGQGVQVTRILPDQDAIDAFVLTFRFFYQDNEKSSFRQISQTYKKLAISSKLKGNFVDWRKGLNDYLDKKIGMTIQGKNPSRRELLDIFIYGGLAHANPQKKAIYDEWKKMGFVYSILEVQFCSVLEVVLRAILSVAEINKKTMTELQANQRITRINQ